MAKAKDEPATTSVATQLRDLLAKATAEDVKELDAEITAKESELDKLKANRKLLAQAVGIEEPKQHWTRRKKAANGGDTAKPASAASSSSSASGPAAAGTDLMEKRRKVLRWVKENGEKHLDRVSQGTGISRFGPGALGTVVIHEWFHTTPDGTLKLTDKGDRAANELR